jgi:hypothetical protein
VEKSAYKNTLNVTYTLVTLPLTTLTEEKDWGSWTTGCEENIWN